MEWRQHIYFALLLLYDTSTSPRDVRLTPSVIYVHILGIFNTYEFKETRFPFSFSISPFLFLFQSWFLFQFGFQWIESLMTSSLSGLDQILSAKNLGRVPLVPLLSEPFSYKLPSYPGGGPGWTGGWRRPGGARPGSRDSPHRSCPWSCIASRDYQIK